MVFYFTATGNSLYAAKHFDDNIRSIPQEMKKENRLYQDESIGIVCPLYEFDIPGYVKEFIENSQFDTDYFYLVITFGKHDGGSAKRVEEYLQSIGKPADYINTVIMTDNAISVFDMEEQKAIEEEKEIDSHLALIRKDLDERKSYIQPALPEEVEFCNGYYAMIEKEGPAYVFPLFKVEEQCIGCGICSRVCPRGCIKIENGKALHDFKNCIHCLACIQNCPKMAIQFQSLKEPNPKARFRNSNISLKEIIDSNNQG